MKGLVKLTPESLIDLNNQCIDYVKNFDLYTNERKRTERRFSWLNIKSIEHVYYDAPFWYQYKSGLIDHFYGLYKMYCQAVKNGDEIWLSEISYKHMCLLKDGSDKANPIFIMNY